MSCRLSSIAIDCADPELLARFWCPILGYQVVDRDTDGVSIAPPGSGEGAAVVTIDFLVVPDPKASKVRIHLDLSPTDGDQSTELARLRELGARPVDIGQGEQTWEVLADPEGNEFCLLRTRRPDLAGVSGAPSS